MGTIIDLIQNHHNFIDASRREHVEGYERMVIESRDNYLLVHSKYWDNPDSFQLQFEAFEYGIMQGMYYLQDMMKKRAYAYQDDSWHYDTIKIPIMHKNPGLVEIPVLIK